MADEHRPVAKGFHPTGDVHERLKAYRLDRFVKALHHLPPAQQDLHFDPGREDTRQYYVRAEVGSLEDLKAWIGLPDDHVDHDRHQAHLKHVQVPDMPAGGDVLGRVPPQTLADAEHNVLQGRVSEDMRSHPFWKAVIDNLLKQYRFVYILVIDHLDVATGHTVTLSNTPTAFFNRVTVHGSGSIRLDSSVKIIADVVEHVP